MQNAPVRPRDPAATVVIAVPPGAQSLDVSGPLDVFREAARQSDGKARYDVRLLSMDNADFIKVDGMTIAADISVNDADFAIDTLLVAGTPNYHRAFELQDFLAWLKRRTPGVRRYGSVCTGVFFLGAAGLLEGRTVTTHWQNAVELASLYPGADVLPDSIFVEDGPLYTSAGVSAGIDLALKLIEDDHGRELALAIARRLVVFLRRPGGQSQFSAHLAAASAGDTRIGTLQQWIVDNVQADLTLKTLAARTGMSLRNFTRVFHTETGGTPADFVELARVDAAKRMLEDSDAPLKRVATHCGFSSADIMRRAFLRRLAVGPKDYRLRFRR